MIPNKVCIINCFDTYEHRVDLLRRFFISSGADVEVYVSDFRHFEKNKRTDEKEGFKFFSAAPYKKNISFKRLKSHVTLAKNIFHELSNHRFDLIWVFVPPNCFAKEAANYKLQYQNVKIVFDIIDLWPETMPISRFKSSPPFLYWKHLRNKHLNVAYKIVTECNFYQEKLPRSIANKFHTIYLARELREFNSQVCLPKDRIALCYLGSINNIIDISVIVKVIIEIKKFKDVVINIIGDGENRELLIKSCIKAGSEVVYHGKIYDPEVKQKIFASCHYGLNVMKESVFVGLTMKSLDYFEAGLPIINNIHGDTWDFVENAGIGYNISSDTNFSRIIKYNMSQRQKVRKFYEDNFSVEAFYSRLSNMFFGDCE